MVELTAQVLRERTSREGLKSEKARELLTKHGKNQLVSGRKKNAAVLFFSQFKDLLILILLVSTGISVMMLFSAFYRNTAPKRRLKR